MATIEKDAVLLVPGTVEQPLESFHDAPGGGAFVQDHANVFGVETALLQDGAHQEHVVDTALESVRFIWIIVDPDKQGASFRFAYGTRPDDGSGARRKGAAAVGSQAARVRVQARIQRDLAPDGVHRVGMPEIL